MKLYREDKIKAALDMQCMNLSASDALKQRIEKEIMMKNAEKQRVHFSKKRLIIGVVLASLLISTGVAAGKTAGYKSSISLNHKYNSYGDLDKAEERLGYEVDAVEGFENGYQFRGITVDKTDAIDEEGNTLYSFPEMWILYERAGSPKISLVINKPLENGQSKKAPDRTKMCGDVELRNDIYTYKFVPPGYELTEEDKINEQRDDYYISVGSEQVEIKKSMHVTWEKDGAHYNLFGFDLDVTGEELLEMAEEILKAN